MSHIISPDEIRRLGIEWPRYPRIEFDAVIRDDMVDLDATLAVLRRRLADREAHHAALRRQLREWPGEANEITDDMKAIVEAVASHRAAVEHVNAVIAALDAERS